MSVDLPKSTWDQGGDPPRCPWCNGYMDEATVTLGQMATAWDHFAESAAGAEAGPLGEADPCAMVTECPACAHPSMVIACWRGGGPILELRPVRTKADIALLMARSP